MITAPTIHVVMPFAMPPFICSSVTPESCCHDLRNINGEYQRAPTMTLTSTAATKPAIPYFPPAGEWARRSPVDVGMDAVKLQEAVDFAKAHGSTWDFERDQVRTFGRPLGPLPKSRAATNGVILRHGFIVAE